MFRTNKRFLIFLFLFSFLIRGLFFVLFLREGKNHFLIDSQTYHEVGVSIAKGNGITLPDGKPLFFRVPGYPLFLGLIYKIFGVNSVDAMWVQIVLASFISVLIFFLSLALFPQKLLLAKLSSVFASIHLGFVTFSGLLMTESLFCLLFILFWILFFRYFNSYKCLFFSGVVLGLASLVRYVGIYLIILLFLMLLFNSRLLFLSKIKRFGVLFAGWFLVVSSWLLRNYILTGFLFFHTWMGVHFVHYAISPIYMRINNTTFSQASRQLCINEWGKLRQKKEKELGRELYEIENCIIGEKLALGYILKYPFLFIKNSLYNIFKTFCSLYSSNLLNITSGYPPCCYKEGRTLWNLMQRFLFPKVNNFLKIIIWLDIFFQLIILLGFFLGLFNIFFDKELLFVVLNVLPIVGLMIFITLAAGFSRLRLPVEPFLIILSFNFWVDLFKKKVFCYEKI